MTEILREAERVDREESARHGEARGDELPPQLQTREARRAALKAAREKLERERAAAVEAGEEVIAKVELELDRGRFPAAMDRAGGVAAPRTQGAGGPARARAVAGSALAAAAVDRDA